MAGPYLTLFQPPAKNLQHGDILGYRVGYKYSDHRSAFKYKTVKTSQPPSEVEMNYVDKDTNLFLSGEVLGYQQPGQVQ